MKKMNVLLMAIALVAVFAIGVGVGATMRTVYADTMEYQNDGNLKAALNQLTGEDVNILIKGMDPLLIEQANAICEGNNNPLTFVGTYCMLDPDFVDVVLTYVGTW